MEVESKKEVEVQKLDAVAGRCTSLLGNHTDNDWRTNDGRNGIERDDTFIA